MYTNNKNEYLIHCMNCDKDFFDKDWVHAVCPNCGSEDVEPYESCDICDKPYLESDSIHDNSYVCDDCYEKYYYDYDMFNEFIQSKNGNNSAEMLTEWFGRKNAFMIYALLYNYKLESAYDALSNSQKYEAFRSVVENDGLDIDDYNYFINQVLKSGKKESFHRNGKKIKENYETIRLFPMESSGLHDNWYDGQFGPYYVTALIFEEPSRHGINNGRISKLSISNINTGNLLCTYDRGWDIKPADEVKELYNSIIKKYN